MLVQRAGGAGPAAQVGGGNGLQSWNNLGRLMVQDRLRDTDPPEPLSSPCRLLESVTCSKHRALCPSTVHIMATPALCATAPVPPAGDASSWPRKERKCLGDEPGTWKTPTVSACRVIPPLRSDHDSFPNLCFHEAVKKGFLAYPRLNSSSPLHLVPNLIMPWEKN